MTNNARISPKEDGWKRTLPMMDHQTTQVLTKHVSSTSNKGYLRETPPPNLTALQGTEPPLFLTNDGL